MLDEFLIQLFYEGQCLEAYKVFGAHLCEEDEVKGVRFTVFAPNAKKVFVVGEFNEWQQTHPLKKMGDGGIYSGFVPKAKAGQLYKYLLIGPNGQHLYKADPYARFSEVRPGNASRIYDLERFRWGDKRWLAKQDKQDRKSVV